MKVLRVENKHITPHDANYLLGLSWEYQRPITRRKLIVLRDEFLLGNINPSTTITLAELNGHTFLVDGQHRLTACVDTGMSFYQNVSVVKVESSDDLKRLWARFDVGAARSLKDSMSAFSVGKGYDLSRADSQKVIASVRYMASGFVPSGGRFASSHENFVPVYDFWVPTFELWKEKYKDVSMEKVIWNKLKSAYCLSVIMATVHYQPELAIQFWKDLAGFENMDTNKNASLLYRYLLRVKTRNAPVTQIVTTMDITKALIYVWNKQFYSQEAKHIKPKGVKFVAGTPFKVGEPYTDLNEFLHICKNGDIYE